MIDRRRFHNKAASYFYPGGMWVGSGRFFDPHPSADTSAKLVLHIWNGLTFRDPQELSKAVMILIMAQVKNPDQKEQRIICRPTHEAWIAVELLMDAIGEINDHGEFKLECQNEVPRK